MDRSHRNTRAARWTAGLFQRTGRNWSLPAVLADFGAYCWHVGGASPVENRLPEAFQRIQAVLQRHGLPLMVRGKGYLHETLELSQQPSTIGEIDPQDLRGHHYLLPV